MLNQYDSVYLSPLISTGLWNEDLNVDLYALALLSIE